ncbi:MAG: hydantoinase B/oxoprolinase family protein, partial [Chromatiales bacterium]|nr:hydantoinase B/oxoprolinase family protein [Chromatiales bacterium]
SGISLGGYKPDGTPFVYLEFMVGSWGAGPQRDGMDACTGIIVNYANTPIELVESEQPLRIERYGFIDDTGGAGRHRGGLSLERHFRFLEHEAVVQVRSDRRKIPPYGLQGGSNGARSMVRIRRANGDLEEMPSKFLTTLKRNDVIEIRLPSGGGFGDARMREPQAVLADVIDQKMSIPHAAANYGVAITSHPATVDWPATERLRADSKRTELEYGAKNT